MVSAQRRSAPGKADCTLAASPVRGAPKPRRVFVACSGSELSRIRENRSLQPWSSTKPRRTAWTLASSAARGWSTRRRIEVAPATPFGAAGAVVYALRRISTELGCTGCRNPH